MNYLRLLVALTPVLVLSPVAARAETSTTADHLQPLELRAISHEADNAALDTVAYEINESVASTDSDLVTISDVVQIPFIEDMLDDNGNLNLPMGLTVYTTMGDPSVGFGSNF